MRKLGAILIAALMMASFAGCLDNTKSNYAAETAPTGERVEKNTEFDDNATYESID